jgi:hypothetical protein
MTKGGVKILNAFVNEANILNPNIEFLENKKGVPNDPF